MTQIALQMYTVRRRIHDLVSQLDALKKVRAAGYRAIQGGMAPAGLTNQTYKNFLDGLGLTMASFGGGLDGIAQNIKGYTESCHFFGQDEIMIGCLPTPYRFDEDGYKRGVEEMNRVGRELKKEGVYISFHNHAQEFRRFADGRRGIDIVLEDSDPDCVRIMPDTHWVQAGGADVLEFLKGLKGRIQYLHVKDYRIKPVNSRTGIGETYKEWAEIGQGNLPWEEIIKVGKELGLRAYIVEQDDTYDRDPFESVRMSYDYLRSLGLQ